jgi:hypothetical protein
MLRMLWGLAMSLISVKRAREAGRAGLRWMCLVALIALVIQFALGVVLNLYVALPDDSQASYIKEIETAPGYLTAHALVGTALLVAAALMMLRAIALRDTVIITLVGAGLAALAGAFVAGEVFVKNSANSASLWMAILTGVALVSYISLQAVLGQSLARGPVPGYLANAGD